MIRLDQALADFKRQLTKALVEMESPRSGAALEAERVTLTLELEARQNPGSTDPAASFFVIERRDLPSASYSNGTLQATPSSQGKHTLVMEFKIIRGELKEVATTAPFEPSTEALETNTSAASLRSVSANDPTLLEAISTILGAPGFDSSARASILREVMQDFPAEKIIELTKALKAPPGTPASEDIRQRCHLLRGILLSGPLKSAAKGAEIFEQIFTQYSAQSVLHYLDANWKTQDDWI